MTQTLEEHTKISSDLSIALAQGSPSGLAWIANARTTPDGKVESSWRHAPHVEYLDNILLQLAARELRAAGYVGVIITEPPRVGKSTLTSHFFPAWYLGAFPEHRVMLGSYSHDFATDWGGKVRDTLVQFGPAVYGIQVDQRSAAAANWSLKGHKGGMNSTGIGGSFTGRGANLLIVDDPIKNSKEAASETIRNAHYQWYKTTARTRLEPEGIICLIATRWHEDDLLGRLIRDMKEDPDADQYLIINLPMLALHPEELNEDEEYLPDPLGRQPGEPLWEDRYDLAACKQIKASVGLYNWASMYQQRPSPKEGALFQREWFNIVPRTAVPPLRKIVRCWDFAATEEGEADDPDWTVGAKIGISEEGRFYILDMVRIRETPGTVERTVKFTAAKDTRRTRIRFEQEPGSSGKTVVSHYRRRVVRGYNARGVRSTGDKVLRAELFAGFAEQGDVDVVQGPWNSAFFYEVTRFPNGAHDDIVDAFSGGIDELTRRNTGRPVTF